MAKAEKKTKPETKSKKTEAKPKVDPLLAEVKSFPAEQVRRSSIETTGLLEWLETLATRAEEDRAELLRVPMAPDPNLTEAELSSLVLLSKFAREQRNVVLEQRSRNVGPDSREELLSAGRAAQQTVASGLRHLFRKDATVLAELTEIRKGSSAQDFLDDVPRLRGLVARRSADFAALPYGESAALETMEKCCDQLSKLEPAKPTDLTPQELFNRAMSIAKQRADRILAAGKYAFRMDAKKRKHYKAYKPKGSKRKASPSETL